jgi:hypothetical protein
MAYAAEEPAQFTDFYQAEVPAGQSHWHYNADRTVKLDVAARRLFLRYTGDPAVNNLRIYTHSVDDERPVASPVVITHQWIEAGELKTFSVTRDRPGAYVVITAGEPMNVFVELAIPSKAP